MKTGPRRYANILAIEAPKKIIAKTIVATNSIFSTPRLVEYVLSPPPPKVPDKPEPRRCIRIDPTSKAEANIWIIVIIFIMFLLEGFSY